MRENNKGLLPHPKIFYQTTVSTSNQQEYRKNYLKEILKRQEETNDQFTTTVTDLNKNLQQGLTDQENNYEHIRGKLNVHDTVHQKITESLTVHQGYFQQITDKLNTQDINQQHFHDQLKVQTSISDELHESIRSTETSNMQIDKRLDSLELLVEEEMHLSQATLDQLAFQEDLTRGIHNKLEKYEELYEDIQTRLSEQEHIYLEINEKFQIQEMFHKSVMDRLDSQDAVSQKMSVQMEMLKQTLVEKLEAAILSIDSKYKQTLQYLAGMIGLKERIIQKPTSEIVNKEQNKVEVKQE